MLRIFYGRECLDKEKFIYDNIGGRGLLIVPDQFTLEAERELIEHSGARALMDVEVLSMSRLGYRLLEELGGSKRTFIDKYGRHMILSDIAMREREKLQVFRGMEEKNSFIELVNNFISEMKQYNCGADELAEIAKNVPDGSYTQRKLEDLHLLFSEYEKAIDGKYTDSEDYIDLFLGKIGQSKLIAGNHVWIYGFDSFAPKAMSVVGELMKHAADVNLVMTWDEAREARDADLFALSEIVIGNFERMAAACGVEARRQRIPESYRAERAEEIQFVEREIYALPAREFRAAGAVALTMVCAANLYNEAESAACYVLSLVRDAGYRFSDIKVICNDQETRGPILRRVFKEYGIDLVSDSTKDIMQSGIVQYILSLMDLVVERCRTDIVIKMLKSGFAEISNDEVTDLENYAIKYKIRGTMWKKDFKRGEAEYGTEEFTRLNAIRERALAFMPDLEAIFKAGTVSEFIAGLYGFLYERVELPKKIGDLLVLQQDAGRPDLAEQTAQVWGKVLGIFDQMEEIMGGQKFRASAFRELLEVGLSQVEIGVLPPTRDGLMMGTMQRTRTGRMKALVVVGANEGILPSEEPGSGLFGSDEKKLFKDKGIELCKVDDVRFLEERMGIYRNLSKPSEKLWISYSLSDAEGGPCRPSAVFSKLVALFPDTAVARDVLNQATDEQLAVAGPAGLRHLTEALQAACEGRPLPPHWRAALSWYHEHEPESLEPIRRGIGFTNQQEELGKQMAAALYTKTTPPTTQPSSQNLEAPKLPETPDLTISPSRLERYARCPFSHFILYGLRPEERRIFELAPREIGDIYHECLMQISRKLTVKGVAITDPASPWMTIAREECRAFVESVIASEAGTYRDGLLAAGNEEKYRTSRITDICDKVCWAMIEQVRSGEIESSAFEAPFGRGKKIEPITVELEDGKRAYIEGKIDRVDYLPGGRVKIIDYKTGNESFSISEAEAGYRLQLMLYLEAAIDEAETARQNKPPRKPAGVFYFKIAEPMTEITAGTPSQEEIEDKIQKAFRLNGVVVDEPAVIRSVAGDFTGVSDTIPVRLNKEGVFAGTGAGNLLTADEFDELREKVGQKVSELCNSLAKGDIAVHPMKTHNTSACAYCNYKGICRFDTIFEGCSYNIVH